MMIDKQAQVQITLNFHVICWKKKNVIGNYSKFFWSNSGKIRLGTIVTDKNKIRIIQVTSAKVIKSVLHFI